MLQLGAGTGSVVMYQLFLLIPKLSSGAVCTFRGNYVQALNRFHISQSLVRDIVSCDSPP